MQKKLSVIVTVYNGEKYLKESLESIAGQTFRDFELVIVNDGSTDATADIIKEFDKAHDDIEIKIIQQSNQGQAQARKNGIDISEAVYLGCVDADDWIDGDYYEKLMQIADDTSADIICSGYTENPENGKKRVYSQKSASKGTYIASSEEARLMIFNRKEVFQFLCNKIIKKDIISEVNAPSGSLIGEDFYILMQCIDEASSVALSENNGYHYRRHSDNITKKYGKALLDGFNVYRKYVDNYVGSEEEARALSRYMMLEYMSVLWKMCRSGQINMEIEEYILRFMKDNRFDYVLRSHDGAFAKAFAALINDKTVKIISAKHKSDE